MKQKYLALMLAVLVSIPGLAQAGIEKAGTTGANFLSVGTGAGILGMGGATLGYGNDLNAAAWNAAALGWVGPTQFGLSHSSLGDDQSQEWLTAGGRWGTTSTSWAVNGLYVGQGTFEGRDAAGNPTSDFSASSTALGATVAQRFGDRVSVGIGAKYVREDLGSVTGSGVTFDGGFQVRAGRVGFGAAVQNITGNLKFDNFSYRFPTNYGAGVSVDLPEYGLRVALDANAPSAYYSDVRGGVEWRWKDQFALRTGYRAELGAEQGEPLGGPSFGMGAGVGGFWFDYGYVISGIADGGQHQLGITVHPKAFMGGAFGASSDAVSPKEPVLPERDDPPAPVKKAKPKPSVTSTPKAEPEVETPVAPKKAVPKPAATKSVAPQKAAPVKAAPVKAEAEAGEAAPAAKKTITRKAPKSHEVQAGETLFKIANRYGTTVPKIMDLNNMVNTTIHVGQVLKLPRK